MSSNVCIGISPMPKRKEKATVSEICSDFGSTTTAHGFGHITVATTVLSRVFWIFLVIGLAVALGNLIAGVVVVYSNNQVATTIQVKRLKQMNFPAITICNLNTVRGQKTNLQDAIADAGLTNVKVELSGGVFAVSSTTANKSLTNSTSGEETSTTATGDATTTATVETTPATGNATATGDNYYEYEDYPDYIETEDGSTQETAQREPGPIASKKEFLKEMLTSWDNKQKLLAGHQVCDMVFSCTFNQKMCRRQFKPKLLNWDPDHGNCYTFNLGDLHKASKKASTADSFYNSLLKTSPIGTSFVSGPKYGLTFTLNMEPEEYLSQVGNQVGVKVIIHNQTNQPFPEDEGIVVAPGMSTYIGLTRTVQERLGVTYDWGIKREFTKCVDSSNSDKFLNMYNHYYKVAYTEKACRRTCYQLQVINFCKCYDNTYPVPVYVGNGTIPCPYDIQRASRTTDNSKYKCMKSVEFKFATGILDCDCPPSCYDDAFSKTISSSSWPLVADDVVCSDVAKELFLRVNGSSSECDYIDPYESSWFSIMGSDNILTDKAMEKKFVNALCNGKGIGKKTHYIALERFAQVHIYYSDFAYQKIVEMPEKTLLGLISDMGGLFGLCLGFSMVTFVEFVQFFFKLWSSAVYGLTNCCGRNKRAVEDKG